ncbi:hypothetical protein CAPTEDRAFT_203008 [Capitella teleta]|uniref:G-protein coupled receptors family 1 profile domain-containing protein n=1 Tax=Capitella teleta TaxID=283909 RepID=R7TML8_CAPTE|nr:hypothetical protein CAPTEDRAFT_203008 [Capitella teleta]|eukprot:ELT95118.1 hypothetical protein CAPTEDRAFT_203008 [Capitella teleta]
MNRTTCAADSRNEMKWISVVFGIIGIVPNICTIICITRYRNLRNKVTNILIGNLCACGVLLSSMPLMGAFKTNTLEESFGLAVSVAALYMSLLIILLIGVDRMIAVADPIGYKIRMTQKKAGLALVIMWISCFVFFMGSIIPTRYGSNMYSVFPLNVHRFFILPASYLLIITVVVIYLGIIIEFRRQSKRTRLQFSGQFLPAIRRSRYLTKMTLFILITFLANWLPSAVVMSQDRPAEDSLEEDFAKYHLAKLITNSFLHASSFTNCLVYAFTNPEYRKAYKDLLCCKGFQVNPSSDY